jgi:hypothetical protein
MDIEVTQAIAAPSAEEIASVEAFFEVSFPESYRRFLAYGNGGKPTRQLLRFGNDDHVIERFLCILDDPTGEDPVGQYDIEVVEAQIFDRLDDDPDSTGCTLVPIASLFAGDFLCLDYRGAADEPIVVIWEHELSEEFAPHTTFVAKSFSDVAGMLEEVRKR